MASYKIFTDNTGNELKAYRNNRGLLFMEIGDFNEDQGMYNGHIVLNKTDVEELIKEMTAILPHLEEIELETPEN